MLGPAAAFDFHAHYVATELIEALARDGPRYGLTVRDEADGRPQRSLLLVVDDRLIHQLLEPRSATDVQHRLDHQHTDHVLLRIDPECRARGAGPVVLAL